MTSAHRKPASRNQAKAQPPNAAGAVAQAAESASSAINGAADAAGLSERVAENPYGMVSAALAIGYVAGGGLFTATTARLVALGFKLATVPFVQDHVLGYFESALDGVLRQTRKFERK